MKSGWSTNLLLHSPTLGFNIKTLEYKNFKLNMWDVGGQTSIRSYWRNYFEQTGKTKLKLDALVWCVDSCDRTDRLVICKKELHSLLQEERLAGASLLIFCNKQDLPNALSQEQIRKMLDLDSIHTHHWSIQACSAKKGDPLEILQGLNWLINDVGSRLYSVD